MSGMIKTFYYPWTRDEMHRRTIAVVPGCMAMYSESLYGQKDTRLTFLTVESSTVAAMDEYYSGIIERCRTMVSIYALDNQEKLLERLREIAKIQDSGIYKSSRLSSNTLPSSALSHMRTRATPFTQELLDCYSKNEHYRVEALRNNVITDIMCLPSFDDVMSGKEFVPGTKTSSHDHLFYTPSEYRLHLRHIVWYLETFPNYRAIFMDDPVQNDVVIYTKGDEHALMIKESEPYTLFEVTERGFASSLCNYLHHMASTKIRENSRQTTIDMLRREAEKVDAALAARGGR